MYGLINKTIEELVIEKFGNEKWSEVMDHSKTDPDAFITNNYYPDEVTLGLVGSASEVLEMSVGDLLFAFGEYWILKTGVEKYGAILSSNGTTLEDFLVNLPSFHSRVMLIYPEITPPDFFIDKISDKEYLLHYHSERDGLTEFMRGLISGMGKMFDIEVDISLESPKSENGDHDIFRIKW